MKDGRVTFRLEDGRVLDMKAGEPQLRHIDHAWASTVHAFQGRTVDNVIATMEAGHPHLTMQKSFYVEISRARNRAELVTDDAKALREQLQAVTGERKSTLEAVEPKRATGQVTRITAGRNMDRERDASVSQERERGPRPEIEKVRESKSIDRDFGL